MFLFIWLKGYFDSIPYALFCKDVLLRVMQSLLFADSSLLYFKKLFFPVLYCEAYVFLPILYVPQGTIFERDQKIQTVAFAAVFIVLT